MRSVPIWITEYDGSTKVRYCCLTNKYVVLDNKSDYRDVPLPPTLSACLDEHFSCLRGSLAGVLKALRRLICHVCFVPLLKRSHEDRAI